MTTVCNFNQFRGKFEENLSDGYYRTYGKPHNMNEGVIYSFMLPDEPGNIQTISELCNYGNPKYHENAVSTNRFLTKNGFRYTSVNSDMGVITMDVPFIMVKKDGKLDSDDVSYAFIHCDPTDCICVSVADTYSDSKYDAFRLYPGMRDVSILLQTKHEMFYALKFKDTWKIQLVTDSNESLMTSCFMNIVDFYRLNPTISYISIPAGEPIDTDTEVDKLSVTVTDLKQSIRNRDDKLAAVEKILNVTANELDIIIGFLDRSTNATELDARINNVREVLTVTMSLPEVGVLERERVVTSKDDTLIEIPKLDKDTLPAKITAGEPKKRSKRTNSSKK